MMAIANKSDGKQMVNKNKEKEVKQYIVFRSVQYGIDISYVDNIVRMQKITRVPKAQDISRESSIFEAKSCRL